MKTLTNNKRTLRSRIGGFTIEEVVVAVSIIGITATATVSGYTNVSKRSEWSNRQAAASQLAAQRIEQVRSARWDTLASPVVDEIGKTSFTESKVLLDLPQRDEAPVEARLQTSVEQISDDPPLKLVRVDIIWPNLDGRVFTNTLVSYRAPNQ